MTESPCDPTTAAKNSSKRQGIPKKPGKSAYNGKVALFRHRKQTGRIQPKDHFFPRVIMHGRGRAATLTRLIFLDRLPIMRPSDEKTPWLLRS
jgi:hypothetical protein